MGYCATYHLSVHMADGSDVSPDVQGEMGPEEMNGGDIYLGRLLYGPRYCSEWPDSLDDLHRVSQKHPGILFTLDCTGEDGTRWREYALDGRTQVCETVLTFQPLLPERWVEYDDCGKALRRS